MLFGDLTLITMEKEVPLALSKQEESSISLRLSPAEGLAMDIGVSRYTIEDLLFYQMTQESSFLATSTCVSFCMHRATHLVVLCVRQVH